MLYRQNRKRSYSIALLLSVSFVLQFVATPNTYAYHNPSKQSNYQPYTAYGEEYFIRDYTGSELLGNAEIKYIVVRNQKDLQRILSRSSDVLVLSIFTLGILLTYISTYHKNRQERLPLMGAFLGGHAPPDRLYSYL